jgi:hypothetical protein
MSNQGKLLAKHNTRYVVFLKGLPWLGIEMHVSNIANIFLSQYCVQNIVCEVGLKVIFSL